MLEVLDKLAENTALRYVRVFDAEARVVTAAMDDLDVRNAPEIDRDIALHARINCFGTTSMEVGVRVEQDDVHIASCYFTMVARKHDRSLPVPPLEYVAEQDQRRRQRATERRNAHRNSSHALQPTMAEFTKLHELHRALESSEGLPLLAKDQVTNGWERTYPEYENVPQTIFGGFVTHRAYMYAHLGAELVADRRALLVSSSRIDFYQAVRMGDKLHFVSQVTYTSRTSLTVGTSITCISRDRRMTALSNNCVFTFVNVDADLNLVPVTQVFPATYTEDARYLAALRRHQRRTAHISASGSIAQPD